MSADEKFDFLDLAAYQYEKYCKVVLQKKRLDGSEIETMMGALMVEPKEFEDGVRYLLRTGEAGYGDSCAFSRALKANWRNIPFPIPEGREEDVKRVVEMSVYQYWEIEGMPRFARYQYKSLSEILGVNESYCGPVENPFAVDVPELLISATMLFESDKIPLNVCNAEIFSETLRRSWREIPVTGETQQKLEQIAEMTLIQYKCEQR